jgi:hypothetical protein
MNKRQGCGSIMTEFTDKPLYNKFIELCSSANRSIKLCAPFVKSNIISEVMSVKDSRVPVELITRLNLQYFHRKVSDIGSLNTVMNAGGNVYNCTNLHAKIYIFDEERVLITSANITSNGLKYNLECGVLSDECLLVQSAVKSYRLITQNDDVSRIGIENTTEIQLMLDKLQPLPHVEYPNIELSATFDGNLSAITDTLSGWKLAVFKKLDELQEIRFDISIANRIASELATIYPHNNNREAKVRQILQQLRDIGLIEFSGRGVYKKLWMK